MDDHRGCLCCVHVLRGERPALLISNSGGIWQAMCGFDDHDFDRDDGVEAAKDAVAVPYAQVLDRDDALAALEELIVDWSARRESVDAPWVPYHDPD